MSIRSDMAALVGNGIFGATFIKEDGSVRTGSFRLGVRKGVKGVGLNYNPEERGNLIVYDMREQDFRTIKLERLIRVRIAGTEVLIQPGEEK